jgi:hypothetical protein
LSKNNDAFCGPFRESPEIDGFLRFRKTGVYCCTQPNTHIHELFHFPADGG